MRHDDAQVPSLHDDPEFGLVLDKLEDVEERHRLLSEYSSISLVPNNPADKHGDGSHGLPVCSIELRHISPPTLDVALCRPPIYL